MVGQSKLLDTLKNYTIDSFPSTLMLVGEKGSGKHTIIKELSDFLKVPLINISNNLNYDDLMSLQLQSTFSFYLIELDSITEKEQNVILKFIEEPTKNYKIILLANSTVGVLNTVINRCVIYNMMPYTKEELKTFLKDGVDESILRYCNTPGQILSTRINMDSLMSLCDDIINRFKSVRFDIALGISNKLNFKDNYDRFDIDIFLKVLLQKLFEDFISNNNRDSLKLYNIVNSYDNKMRDVRLNKEILIDSMLTQMWGSLR